MFFINIYVFMLNTYSIWGNDFEEITFNHLAGTYYEYLYSVAFVAGVNNEQYYGNNMLTMQTAPTSLPPGPAPVPEPATLVLFGLGILGLAGISRKK